MTRQPTLNDDRRGEDLEEQRQPGGWGDLAQLDTDYLALEEYERGRTGRWDS